MKRTYWFLAFLLVAFPAILKAEGLVNVDRTQRTQWYLDDTQLWFGSLPDAACKYDTNQTHDALICGLSTDSERLILTKKSLLDAKTNFGFSDLNRPGLTITSADGTKEVTISHDGTNAVISTSSGKISFPQGVDAGTGNGSFGTSVIFEGATDDASETTLTVVDPTADRTVSIPDASGTILLSTAAQDAANSVKGIANGFEYEGATANAFETQITIVDPTADRSIAFPDSTGTVILSSGVADVANAVWGTNNGFVFEGATADANELTLQAADPSSDVTVTVPAVTGTICVGGALVVTSAANTACNTTCGAGKCCGAFDSGTSLPVGCASATADACTCMP